MAHCDIGRIEVTSKIQIACAIHGKDSAYKMQVLQLNLRFVFHHGSLSRGDNATKIVLSLAQQRRSRESATPHASDPLIGDPCE